MLFVVETLNIDSTLSWLSYYIFG